MNVKPIKISEQMPEIGQYALFVSSEHNGTCFVVRRVTDQERWFYGDTSEIASRFSIDEYTHWIPMNHKHYW